MNFRPLISTAAEFRNAMTTQICTFESARLLRHVADATIKTSHYHAILTTLFHQTYSSPYTFAAAAANCDWTHERAKEFLLRHAEEERTHWRWILDDLRATGYTGPDPRQVFPHPTCEAYISFNERASSAMPLARLAIACVLEGIGGRFGGTYGRKLIQTLGLEKDQATFFLSHGETDVIHMKELDEVVQACNLTPQEWGWMTHAAMVAGQLYRAMYSHEAFA